MIPLRNLQKLRQLDCVGTKISDFRPIAHLSSLETGAEEGGGLEIHGTPALELNPDLAELAKLDQPERTIQVLAYLRGEAVDEAVPSTADGRDWPEVEPQVSTAGKFLVRDGEIDVDMGAGSDQLARDEEAQDRHAEVVQRARALHDLCSSGRSNQLAGLKDLIGHFQVPLGQSPDEVRPSQFVLRGNRLRLELVADEERLRAADSLELSYEPGPRAALRSVVEAFNFLVAFDPYLARMDEARLGPDRTRPRLERDEVLAASQSMRAAGLSTYEVVQTIAEAAANAGDLTSGSDRRARFFEDTAANLGRLVLSSVETAVRWSIRGSREVVGAVHRGVKGGFGMGDRALLTWFVSKKAYFIALAKVHPGLAQAVECLMEAAEADLARSSQQPVSEQPRAE